MSKETKKNKKVYCPKGTRKNPKTGKCEPVVEESNILNQITDDLLRLNPSSDIDENTRNPLLDELLRQEEPDVIIPPPAVDELELINKKRKLILECNKDYVPKPEDAARKEELDKISGPKLRILHSQLINDPSVIKHTPGVKTKDELINILLCLENEKKRIDRFTILPSEEAVIQQPDDKEVLQPEDEEVLQPDDEQVLQLDEPLKEASLDEETRVELINIPKEKIPEAIEPIPSTEIELSDKEKELHEKIGIIPSNIESNEYNAFLFNKEKLENVNYQDNDSYEFLYPELNDPNFNIKITKKKEFNDTKYDGIIYDLKEQANKLCNSDFELTPHQLFVKNFLSLQTPYNCLLLYHGLGTGKTCSSIGIAEEMRHYMKQIGLIQPILIIASPNVQQNYRLQLFDERKLKLEDGLWNLNTCIGNSLLKEINPTNLIDVPKDRIISEINSIINKYYKFMGYIELANYIKRNTSVPDDSGLSKEEKKSIKIKKIHKYFDNTLIIIDEVHNIRISEDNREDAKVASLLMDIVKYTDNMRLLLLSATPMYNNYKEIIWLTNLINAVDKRSTISESDIFDKNGEFLKERLAKDGKKLEGGRELLQRKLTGYISYVRGENPYTFPYRIYPDTFAPEFSLQSLSAENKYPSLQMNKKPIEKPLSKIPVFISPIGEYQSVGYDFIMNHLRNKSYVVTNKYGEERDMPSFENMESFGYTNLLQPLEALNIVFPNEALDNYDPNSVENNDQRNEELMKDIVGKKGLYNVMTYKSQMSPYPNIYDFEYRANILNDEKHGRIFHPEKIGKYSNKISKICESIKNAKGIVLIYSQYIDGGIVPIALALEEMGLSRFSTASHAKNLFKTPPVEPVDALTMKPRSAFLKEKQDGLINSEFQAAKYVMITGNKAYSPDNLADIKHVTNPNNKNGEKVKVIIISKAGSEGLDFKCIRQIHIMEPWYNMSRIEQIVGRGVRNFSHCSLEFEERNVEIYLHSTLPRNDEEPADLYVYRFAENKATMIGKVSRLLKEVAIDCMLNIGQTNFTIEKLESLVTNRNIKIKLSSKPDEIEYKVGDKPFTDICDYMDNCSFICSPTMDIKEGDITKDTYNDDYLKMNYSSIVKRVRQLFRENYFYKREQLHNAINVLKKYPENQIDYVLSRFVDNKNEYIYDQYGRSGYLINKDHYYVFQPIEITDESTSLFERSIPIDYKRNKMDMELPKEKGSQIEKIDAAIEIVEESITSMKEKYESILIDLEVKMGNVDTYREHRSTEDKLYENMPSGETDWYINAGYIYDIIAENHDIEDTDLDTHIINHYLDTMSVDDKLVVVKNLYLNDEFIISNEEYESIFKRYFDEKIVIIRGYKSIIIAADKIVESSEDKLKIFIQDNENKLIWSTAQPTDRISAIKASLQKTLVKYSDMNRLVGFMQVFKNNDIIFKTMDMENKTKKGSKCSGEGKKDVIKKINMISDEFKYNEDNTEDDELINKPGMCVILEILTRHYNYVKKNNKAYFLNLEKAIFSKLVK